MYQVILEMAAKRVHVIAEFSEKEQAIAKYVSLVEANKGSPITPRGKYNIRKKSE
ncbi:MAG: hypothetical protein RMK91_02115 [Pseudanabaenaceae cyanobacterium SKYGB_i_bin29]|nr:hypothetical protein [Pseudanabaenaceae cyanobacterium SKYG29]MDW8420640.1 hypothetical protein [Pseudanabaenaceae cyanobacterium SKYGB_i_bin29]